MHTGIPKMFTDKNIDSLQSAQFLLIIVELYWYVRL